MSHFLCVTVHSSLRFWYFRIQMGFGGGEIEDMILGIGNGQGRIWFLLLLLLFGDEWLDMHTSIFNFWATEVTHSPLCLPLLWGFYGWFWFFGIAWMEHSVRERIWKKMGSCLLLLFTFLNVFIRSWNWHIDFFVVSKYHFALNPCQAYKPYIKYLLERKCIINLNGF